MNAGNYNVYTLVLANFEQVQQMEFIMTIDEQTYTLWMLVPQSERFECFALITDESNWVPAILNCNKKAIIETLQYRLHCTNNQALILIDWITSH